MRFSFHKMDLQKVIFLIVVVSVASSLAPHFTVLNTNQINIRFPKVSGASHIEFEYSLKSQGQSTYSRSSTVQIHPDSRGHLSYVMGKADFIKYTVRYMSSSGQVINQVQNEYTTTGTFVVPLTQTPSRAGTTVFHDTFNRNHLGTSKWHHEITCWGGGNGEFQMYTPEAANTFIKNGVLYLKPTFTVDKFGENFLHHGTLDVAQQWGSCTSDMEGGCHRQGSQNNIPPIMSGKVYSNVGIRYGKIEVVAKIPKGDWIWPAIWLLPLGTSWKYGSWPRSGEIDIMESRGNMNLKDQQGNDQGASQILSTIHFGASPYQHQYHGQPKKSAPGTVWGDGFHTYSLDWTADHIRMDVDNRPVMIFPTPSNGYWNYGHFTGNNIWANAGKDAPFNIKFGLILYTAVGGKNGFFSDSWTNPPHPKPWRDSSGTAMMDFWNNRHGWQSTWHGDDVAMKIKSVKMIQY